MKTRLARVFPLLILFSLTSHIALSQFTLSGEIRPRAEYRNGFKKMRTPGTDPAIFIEQRSRLYVDFAKDKIAMYLSIQDVRIWGSVDQVYKTDPNLQNVFEAWGKYNFNDKFSIKAGRMALNYDGARFLGDLDWAQQSRSHDAFLFKYVLDDLKIRLDFGAAFNQNPLSEPSKLSENFYDHTVTNNYKTMLFLYFKKKWDSGWLSLLAHNDGRQVASDSSMAYRHTLGLTAEKHFTKMDVGIEGYYQTGKNGLKTDVNAYLASLFLKYKTNLTPITLGGDYLSGTASDSENDNSFAPLYGTNHKFYGFMDYFYVGNPHGGVGLIDLYLKTKFKLNDKTSLLVHLHNFSSPVSIPDPADASKNLSSQLGSEFDVVCLFSFQSDFKIHVGYSQMFATESMQALKGANTTLAGNNWAWVMLTFKPTLFTTKKENPKTEEVK